MSTTRSIAVLLTCHNRIDCTLHCLRHLFAQRLNIDVSITVYLVDDGSTDGTGKAVKREYQQVQVIFGDGQMFWNGGMHRAFGEALMVGFDYYLWLNDDTYLYENSLQTMLHAHEDLSRLGKAHSIVVASTRDSGSGNFTYGGYKRKTGFCNALRLHLVEPEDRPVKCDTMCGNCVLIPWAVTDAVGNVDPRYKHRWGDVDYGLRAQAEGCEIWIAPGYMGDCDNNPVADRWLDQTLALRRRIEHLHGLKGFGKEDWLRYTRTHGGKCWFLIWVKPYLTIVRGSLLALAGTLSARRIGKT